jgi:hypothetical protein
LVETLKENIRIENSSVKLKNVDLVDFDIRLDQAKENIITNNFGEEFCEMKGPSSEEDRV